MTQSDAIVDVGVDPQEARRARWRRLARYGIPVASIALVAIGLIASSLYTASMNRDDVMVLSRDFVDALSGQIESEVMAYLAPAQSAVNSLAAIAPQKPLSPDGRAAFEQLAMQLLRDHPQIASAYIGLPDGQFLMVRRNNAGSTDTKAIEITANGRRSTWTRRDADGKVTTVETDPADTYDPRTRDWYGDALRDKSVVWSHVYTFFTDKVPGITASTAIVGNSGPARAVVGADIFLDSLSNLLQRLQHKARGTLAIIDEDGKLVAFHDPANTIVSTDGDLRPRHVSELDLPVFAEAFNRLRVEGPQREVVTIDHERFIFAAASLQSVVARHWWLLLLAPESAYLGFVNANSKRGLIASSGVVLLAVLMAGFLAWQGVVADRNSRSVRASRARFEAQRAVFSDLAGLSGLANPNEDHDLREASEALARAAGARRVSFWRFSSDGSELICIESFDLETHGHLAGVRLATRDFPELFEEMRQGRAFEIADVDADPRAAGLQSTYLQAVGTTSLSSIPIEFGGTPLGAIWTGNTDTDAALDGDHSLARAVANLLAPRLFDIAQAETGENVAARSGHTAPDGNADLPNPSLLRTASLGELRRELGDKAAEHPGTAATVFPHVTTLVLRLLDDGALAGQGTRDAARSALCEIVEAFERSTSERGVPYVKILSNELLAIDGFAGDDAAAAERLIDIAREMRELCGSLFVALGHAPMYAMGLDSGPVFGATVGSGSTAYNVWGEAVRVAATLADTADPGTIQVSEATYDLLHETYIFRRRGAFYLDRIGEMTTYALRGRI